jgi:hypothetical protein
MSSALLGCHFPPSKDEERVFGMHLPDYNAERHQLNSMPLDTTT